MCGVWCFVLEDIMYIYLYIYIFVFLCVCQLDLFPQRIQFAKKDSEVIAKMKGTYVEQPKRSREKNDEDSGKKKRKRYF